MSLDARSSPMLLHFVPSTVISSVKSQPQITSRICQVTYTYFVDSKHPQNEFAINNHLGYNPVVTVATSGPAVKVL